MDPLNIFQFAMYSKVINEITNQNIHPFYLCVLCFTYFVYNNFFLLEYYYNNYFYNDSCTIILTYHKRLTNTYNGSTTVKTTYSDNFHAINYYILNHNMKDIDSLYEIINMSENKYGVDTDLKYVFIPVSNTSKKIRICENPEIFFENIMEQQNNSENTNSDKNSTNKQNLSKYSKDFTYRLSVNGQNNIHIINDFIAKCKIDYIKSKKITRQMIYEYVSTSVDESENREMKFNHFVFKSNKWLDRNVFFENKAQFLENIRKFPYRKDINDTDPVGIIKKSSVELEYEYLGKSFKNIILLHGPPGCGKTSIIKGILNETKRHGIIVQWSRIKTCADFSALFRCLKIDGEKYSSGELCYIFEDFDANKMDLLKKRKNLSTVSSISNDSDDSDESVEILGKNSKNKDIIDVKKLMMSMPINDELTLDYVLNMFDGVMELYNAIIIFTTNLKIDNFDSALIRPGRIDTILEMKECNWNTIMDMLQHYYRLTDDEMIDKYEEENNMDIMVRPCEIESICMKCKNIDEAIREIYKFCNK